MSIDNFTNHFNNLNEISFSLKQTAESLIITCADSRVDPALLFGFNMNEVFVIRHLAAYIPPHQQAEAFLFKETLDLALTALPIKQVLVLGHTECAGHRHLYDSQINGHHPVFKDSIQENIDAFIQHSVHHLKQYPSMIDAINHQKITLSAWCYDGVNKKIHTIDSTA